MAIAYLATFILGATSGIILVLFLTIPVAILAIRLAEPVLNKPAATLK